MSGMHFEQMAEAYATARPPYPAALYETLMTSGIVGPGRRVLEVGAGAGLATGELVRSGSDVVAVEPGRELAGLLAKAVPDVKVVVARFEDVVLPDASFDSVVAATSLHWVDLSVGLPKAHALLRPDGWLATWRNQFGDERVDTPFRRRVQEVVAARVGAGAVRRSDDRPSMEELAAGGWFEPVASHRWRWSIDLSTAQVRRLFSTFSDWTGPEVEAAARAVDELGGTVTENYRSLLHVLRRAPEPQP